MIEFWQNKPLKDYDSVSLAGILREYFINEFPAHYTQKLDNAIQIASYLHRHDVRRGKRGKLPNPPYIEHPLRVAVRMFKYFGVKDPYVLLAAVLHDTVEDHPFEFSSFYGVVASTDVNQARSRALSFISSSVGFECATIVKDVSNPVVPKGISKVDKISQYQEHVENIIKVSSSALLLKLSDFVDNAGSLHHHYEYGDPDVTYFLDRYEPLIPIYRAAVTDRVQFLYDEDLVLDRLDAVDVEFQKFRAANLDKKTKDA